MRHKRMSYVLCLHEIAFKRFAFSYERHSVSSSEMSTIHFLAKRTLDYFTFDGIYTIHRVHKLKIYMIISVGKFISIVVHFLHPIVLQQYPGSKLTLFVILTLNDVSLLPGYQKPEIRLQKENYTNIVGLINRSTIYG